MFDTIYKPKVTEGREGARMASVNRRVLPGFSLSLGLHRLLPDRAGAAADRGLLLQGGLALPSTSSGRAVWTERTRAAYLLTFGAVVRRRGRRTWCSGCSSPGCWCATGSRAGGSMDSLIDLPLALPTAVGGLVYASLYVKNGWLGQYLVPLGIQAAYTPAGHRARAGVHRPALRGAHGAAGAGGPRSGGGGGGGLAGRHALADLPPRDPASAVSRADHRLRPGLRALAGRVRLGGLRVREHALQDGDRARPDRGPPARSSPTAKPPPSRSCCSSSRSRCSS